MLVGCRDRWGLSAEDLYSRLPSWEADLLMAVVMLDRPAGPAGPVAEPDPWGSPPDIPI